MLTLWKPYNEMTRWNRNLDDVFGWNVRRERQSFSPAVDVQELADSFIIKADLPGVKKEEIEIEIEEDTLTISGKRELGSEEEQNGIYRRERAFGTFSRSFTLGPKVATSEIDASYEAGVLTLELPKAEEAKPHKIDVH